MPWSWKRPSIPKKYWQWFNKNYWWLMLAGFGFVFAIAYGKNSWSDWTGFQDKTIWDWLDLLGVPVSLAILGYILQQQQQKRAAEIAKQEREIAADEEREEILQTYFDRLSTLLVDKNILAIATKDEKSNEEKGLLDAAVDVIRARTLSILRRFEKDPERKSSVVRFLIEAEVISKAKLNLEGANLQNANLQGANLQNAILYKANLQGAILYKANLQNANLQGANLQNAILYKANLYKANLEGAILYKANLYKANLQGAVLQRAFLYKANLFDITWDEGTSWPFPDEVAEAKNIPDKLKEQLGINDPPTTDE